MNNYSRTLPKFSTQSLKKYILYYRFFCRYNRLKQFGLKQFESELPNLIAIAISTTTINDAKWYSAGILINLFYR